MPRTRRQLAQVDDGEDQASQVRDAAEVNVHKDDQNTTDTPELPTTPQPGAVDLMPERPTSFSSVAESQGDALVPAARVSVESAAEALSKKDKGQALTGQVVASVSFAEQSLGNDTATSATASPPLSHADHMDTKAVKPAGDVQVDASSKTLGPTPEHETSSSQTMSMPTIPNTADDDIKADHASTCSDLQAPQQAEQDQRSFGDTQERSPVPPPAADDDDDDDDIKEGEDESTDHGDLLDDDNLPPVVRRKRLKLDSADSDEATSVPTQTTNAELVASEAEASIESLVSTIPRRTKTVGPSAEAASTSRDPQDQEHADHSDEHPQDADPISEAKEGLDDEQPVTSAPPSGGVSESWSPAEQDDSDKLRPAMSLKEAAEYLQTLPRRHPESTNDARLFIGNLASESTSQVELLSIFSKYGRIMEQPLMLRSYAFIQYDCPESTQLAIRYEQGRLIGGRHLDLSVASGRRGSGSSSNANANDSHHLGSAGSGPEGKRAASNQGMNRRKRDASTMDMGGPRPPPRPGAPYVRILVIGTTSRPMAHAMQNVIRSLGISTDVAYIFSTHLGTALKEAYAQCVRYMIVVTSKDASKGACSLRTYEKTGYEHAGGGNIMPFHEALAIIFREERINLPVPPAAYTVAAAAAAAATAMSLPSAGGGDTTNMPTTLPGAAPGMTSAPATIAATTPYGYPNPMVSAPGPMPYPFASMPPGYLYGPPPPSAPNASAGVSVQRGYHPGYMAGLPPAGINPPMMHPQHTQVSGNASYAPSQGSAAPPGADMNQVKQLLATLQQFQQRNASARNSGGNPL
ncbi:hypothetical protein CCYA_CCYA04G1357 [Cyanidiococcus yangmingshanensis]|nr:hypothetical protein CCYA_CCYA04G1357 [Cyanidiococcus yangmingshanensis]